MTFLEKIRSSSESRQRLKTLLKRTSGIVEAPIRPTQHQLGLPVVIPKANGETEHREGKVVVSNLAWIPIAQIGGPAAVERLKERLTVHPRSTSPHNPEPDPIICYEETEEAIGVPRDYFARKTTGKYDVELEVTEGLPTSIPKPIRLWDHQNDPVETIVDVFRKGILGGVLEAPCGTGKTVMGLEIARRLGITTLIVVHKEFLMDQWKERIQQHMPEARIGTVWQDSIQFRDKDIVIAMLGSLLSRRYAQAFYEWPGLVITDEVHRIGAPTWGKVIAQFRSRWRLGLSATPRRKDGADSVFLWNIGPVLYRCKEQRRSPLVKRYNTGVHLPARVDGNKLSDAVLTRILSKSTKRNGMIVAVLIKATETGRKIIVFSDLREHLLDLKEGLNQMAPQIHSDVFVGGWFTPEWLASKRTTPPKFRKREKEELKRAEGAQVIFATYAMAKEGLDIDTLNTAFLATPKTDVEQAVGRILRSFGPKEPIIVDFIDECSSRTKQMATSRMKLYKKLGALKVTES